MNEHVAAEIDRIIAADSDLKVEFKLPADAEIHFVGKPILALNPATNNLTVPARFLHHALVRDRYFCTLPRDLWDEVYNCVGPTLFDPDLVELEDTLSSICGDHSQNAGFRNGRAFVYCLRRNPVQVSLDDANRAGMDYNQAQLDQIIRLGEERAAAMLKPTRAYSGWLMTNVQFLGELDELLQTWAEMIRRWGFDRLGIVLSKGMFLVGDDPTADDRWPAYHMAFEQFFIRWRLQGLAAPFLPVPLQPLLAGRFPVSVLPQIMRSGGVFVLPDIAPIPSRDQLRNMLEDSLRGSSMPGHLAEWMAIIASDNAAKKSFIKFARLFEVQHFYRLLHDRHSAALRGRLSTVKKVLAKFFGTAKRTIDEDLTFINKQLGPNWVHRGSDF